MNAPTDDQVAWRIIGGVALGLAVLALLIWGLLSLISPTAYIGMQDDLLVVSEWLLWAAAIGQTSFVLVWSTLPWWTHWVGRALMVKSMSLMIYLDIALVLTHVDYFYGLNLLAVILFGFVVVGIWSQLLTIVHERARNRGRSRTDAEPPSQV